MSGHQKFSGLRKGIEADPARAERLDQARRDVETVHWSDITPEDAVNIQLPHPVIQGPLTTSGEECPWPWDPQQLKGAPLGQYHCPYCGEMVIAGMPHIDYRDVLAVEAVEAEERAEAEDRGDMSPLPGQRARKGEQQ